MGVAAVSTLTLAELTTDVVELLVERLPTDTLLVLTMSATGGVQYELYRETPSGRVAIAQPSPPGDIPRVVGALAVDLGSLKTNV